MAARSSSWCLFVVLLLINLSLWSSARRVTVRRAVSVSRGSSVDLRPALTFPPSTQCQLTHIAGNSACGTVSPNIFNCSYSGAIVYQHYGCFAEKELATFLVSTMHPATSAVILSVEVNVGPAHQMLTELRLDAVAASDYAQTGAINLTLVFPSTMVSHGYYEVLSQWPNLPLPLAGSVEGSVHQLLPAGYVPTSPLVYTPYSPSLQPQVEYVLVKIHLHELVNKTLFKGYVILSFNTQLGSKTSEAHRPEVIQLKGDSVIIDQGVHTPILEQDLNFLNFTLTMPVPQHGMHGHGSIPQPHLLPIIRYFFPVDSNTGSFQSLHSPSNHVSHSVFTSRDLVAGHVTFNPVYKVHFTKHIYHYNITNLVGVVIATGEVSVTLTARDNDGLHHRKNLPLPVLEGGRAAINRSTFDFYECREHAKLQVARQPAHGQLWYRNEVVGSDDEVPLWVLKNSSFLHYQHEGGDELGDVVYWRVKCLSWELTVFMAVLVVPTDDTPPTLTVHQSYLVAYQGWAFPLSPSVLHVVDPDSPQASLRVTASHHTGTLLTPLQNFSDFRNSSNTYPLLSHDSLQRVELHETLSFSPHDLEEQLVWYFPADGDSSDIVELTVSDTINRNGPTIAILQIQILSQPPNESLVISSSAEYPYVIKNHPLPLSAEGHMHLTPYFLYSQAPPSPPENVLYKVTTGLQHGHLCYLTTIHCNSSLKWFSQVDISYRRIIYYPKDPGHLKSDQFSFIVTAGGFSNIHPVTHVFNWTMPPQEAVVARKTLSIQPTSSKRITTKFLRNFVDVLGSSNVSFTVVEAPRYGNLVLKNASRVLSVRPLFFTYADVRDRIVWYDHTQHMTPLQCSDHLTFLAISPLRSVQGKLHIAFQTRNSSELSVTFHPYTLLGLTHFVFTSKSINVSSSFCNNFVTFTLESLPQHGSLTLKDHSHKTERVLQVGSTFTAKDVSSEALSYRFTSPYPQQGNMSDTFRLTAADPASMWPRNDMLRQDTNVGHFKVNIISSPQGEHVLQVRFSSRHPVTWLPSRQVYGYAFEASDIDLLNSTLQPSEVYIQLDGGLILGNLAKGNSPVSLFTVADVYAGEVFYQKNSIVPASRYQDTVALGVYAYLPGFAHRATGHHLVLEWAVLEFEEGTWEVSEQQSSLQLSIRRGGALWFESRVMVATTPHSASPRLNCSLQHHTASGDYCHFSQEVIFPVGVVSQSISIEIVDDEEPEGEETFYVQLVQEEGLHNAILRGHTRSRVTITDIEDHSTVAIVCGVEATGSCGLETSAEEGEDVVISLVRYGNLDYQEGVVCYTEADSATAGTDYIPRSRDSEVVFPVNESTAECIVHVVDDPLLEPRERFIVRLAPWSEHGFVHIKPSADSICVYINYDDSDEPVVAFTKTQVYVKENETQSEYAEFSVERRGTHLNFTTQVKYVHVTNEGDSAVEGEDFRLFTGCMFEGEATESGSGCISFSPGTTQTSLTVEILPDSKLEGNETFHLKILRVRQGRRHENFRLASIKVTIIDATQSVTVALAATSFIFKESKRFESVTVIRTGSLVGRVELFCILKGLTAKGAHIGTPADFLVPQEYERISLEPGQTRTTCNVLLWDDPHYEGVENFTLTIALQYNISGVVLTQSQAIVFITDQEDAPSVQFNVSSTNHTISTSEPLSNSHLDRSSVLLQVVRTGDTAWLSTVNWTTVEGSAVGGVDYHPVGGALVFQEGQTTAEIEILILANPQHSSDSFFTVQLSLTSDSDPIRNPTTFDPASDPTILGPVSNVTVLIQDYGLKGPYFPALPQVVNTVGGVIVNSSELYYDLPLACITACEDDYGTVPDDIWNICQQQNIANSKTLYIWEVSRDGTAYQPLDFSSFFTTTHHRQLDTVYLESDMYVRCTVQAVDQSDVYGHFRTSESVQLQEQHYHCYGREPWTEVTSYSTFSAHDQDLLRLEFHVPAVPNSIPLLATSPLPPLPLLLELFTPSSVLSPPLSPPPCSTISLTVGETMLTHSLGRAGTPPSIHSLYSHLNRSNCTWHFSAWFPLSTLLKKCGAQELTGSRGERMGISLSPFTAYLHIGMDGIELTDVNQTVSSASITTAPPSSPSPSLSPLLPPPLHILSQAASSLPYLVPLSISSDRDVLQMVVYVVSAPEQVLFPAEGLGVRAEMLYMNGVEQAWLLHHDSHLPHSVFSLVDVGTCMPCPGRAYTFNMSVGPDGGVGGDVALQLQTQVHLNQSSVVAGEDLELAVTLSSQQQLQGSRALRLRQLYLCQQVGTDGCFNRLTVMGPTQTNHLFHLKVKTVDAQTISISFSTTAIPLASSSRGWFLHIQVVLSNSNLQQETVVPLSLSSPPPASTVMSTTALTDSSTPIGVYAAALGGMASLSCLMVFCTVLVVTAACRTHGKDSFHNKASLMRGTSFKESRIMHSASLKESGVRLNSSQDSNRVPQLKRTCSTIGFPTQEYRLKKGPHDHLPSRARHSHKTQEPTASSGALKRSHSLPSLHNLSSALGNRKSLPPFFSQDPAAVVRRINPSRTHTRIKKVNLESSKLHSWTSQQLKRNRELSNLHIVQDLAIRHKNYGVNEIQQNPVPSQGMLYARYVVRSLAASANTPEPGSRPNTNL